MNGQSVDIGFLEPFFSGSHKSFALGWQRHSVHRIDIHGLPGRFWKWRMRAAALEFVRIAMGLERQPDLWFATSLLDAAHFKALLGERTRPLALFFHECQASYPLKGDSDLAERDYQYLITDLASAGAADRVYFNSRTLMEDFFKNTEEFLRRMPDSRPLWLLDEIRAKAGVLHLGVDFSGLDAPRGERGRPLRILWPHRWEHDKNPGEFFSILEVLDRRGLDFRLLVAGGAFEKAPEEFGRAKERLPHRIDHWGEVKERGEYAKLLAISDIVVSTALHETFGLSMVEAAWAGAHPLAPERLSYPEVFPRALHAECLYEGGEDLLARLSALLSGEAALIAPATLRDAFSVYDWTLRAPEFDEAAREILQKPKVVL